MGCAKRPAGAGLPVAAGVPAVSPTGARDAKDLHRLGVVERRHDRRETPGGQALACARGTQNQHPVATGRDRFERAPEGRLSAKLLEVDAELRLESLGSKSRGA